MKYNIHISFEIKQNITTQKEQAENYELYYFIKRKIWHKDNRVQNFGATFNRIHLNSLNILINY